MSFLTKADWVTGSDHTDIAFVAFGDYYVDNGIGDVLTYSEEDIRATEYTMSYYTNFAKTG